MATQGQKMQFIALTATAFDPASLNKDQFQVFLEDPEAWSRFGEFINGYEHRTCPPVTLTTIEEVEYPFWTAYPILKGVREPKVIDFLAITLSAWSYSDRVGTTSRRPKGNDILATLVASYSVRQGDSKVFAVVADDLINGHFGQKELKYLEEKWHTLPLFFQSWAIGKLLYGWRDVLLRKDGKRVVGYLDCSMSNPQVGWCLLESEWCPSELALRE